VYILNLRHIRSVLIPKDQAIKLDLSIEEGLKLVLSGGIVIPDVLTGRKLVSDERTHP
jgi:uncharacterized membrane protein